MRAAALALAAATAATPSRAQAGWSGWTDAAVDWVKSQAALVAEGSQQAANATEEAVVGGLVPSLQKALDINEIKGAAGSLAGEGRRAAIKSMLWTTGMCPRLRRQAPETSRRLPPRIAQAFSEAEEGDPASEAEVCQKYAMKAFEDDIDERFENSSSQEKMVLQWVNLDFVERTCNKSTRDAFHVYSSVRVLFPDVYRSALEDRLRLTTLSEDVLHEVLHGYCGKDGQGEDTRLFSQARPSAASQPGAAAAASQLAPLALPAAGLLALATAACVRRRCWQSPAPAARCPSIALVDEEGETACWKDHPSLELGH